MRQWCLGADTLWQTMAGAVGMLDVAGSGGSGSVMGDTTTTMIWIAGISPLDVLHAYVAALSRWWCLIPASFQQEKLSPIIRDAPAHVEVDCGRIGVVGFVLIAAMWTNLVVNTKFPQLWHVAVAYVVGFAALMLVLG